MKDATIQPVKASGPGSLDGWRYVCPTCGMEITYSLESMVVADARAHRAWHDGGAA